MASTSTSTQHQPRRRNAASTLLLLCFTLITANLTGCAVLKTTSETFFMPSTAEEAQLGSQFKQELEKELTYVTDPMVLGYIREVGSKMNANLPQSPFTPEYAVVADPSINAFAIPGGAVFIQTGLILAAEDEAELAGVVGHEAGHVILRHGAKNMSQQYGVQILSGMVLGEQPGMLASLAANVASQGVLLKFSREQESESDAIATQMLYKMGYDPLALASFFDKLTKAYGDRGGVSTWMSSHPNNQQRIDAIHQLAATYPPKDTVRPTDRLRQVQARLRELGYTTQ